MTPGSPNESNGTARPRIRAVLFDIGGVLEVTPSTHWQARWEERLRLPSGRIDELLDDLYRAGTIGSVTFELAEAQIATRLAIGPREVSEVMNDLFTEYLGSIDARLYAWFRGLRPRYKTGLVSNSWVGAREREESAYGFSSACDTIVYSHEEGIEKPDPRIYAIACERLGVRPDEVVFVDDRRANVVAAQALGMHGVLFVGDTAQTIRELDALLAESTHG